MTRPTILVIGGAGYIGSYVCKALHNAGYEPLILDNMSSGQRSAVLYGEIIEGELSNTLLLQTIFKKYPISAVMHFAALIDVGESMRAPARYYQNNVSSTLNLLQTLVNNYPSPPPFIFSSSAAIFGTPQHHSINEEHPCCPINPYGESKWVVEKMLRDFDHAYGLKFSCLRYFNAAGGDPKGILKHPQTKSQNLIPNILRSLNTQSPISIYGTDYSTPDGTCIRDYIHIDDLATAHIKALKNLWNGSSSTHYNLGNGKGFSIREVIRTTEETLKMPIKINESPRRPGDPPILIADPSEAARELQWIPQYGLSDMILHAWQAMKNG